MTTLLDLTDTTLPKGKVKVPPRPVAPEKAPILVNGVEIADAAIRTEAQHHPADTPAKAFAAAARALVVRELLGQEARRLKVAAEPALVGDAKRETDEDAAIRALLDKEVASPKADETTCRRYYDTHEDKFRSETLYEARHILFAAAPNDKAARQQARRAAEATIAELVTDQSKFAALAAERSACPSRAQGGSLGQLTKGSTVPEFETVLFALDEGQLSPAPAPTPFGFHVIALDRIIPGRRLPFEVVQDRIAGWLEASSWSRAVAQYIGILAGRSEIVGIDLDAAQGPLVR